MAKRGRPRTSPEGPDRGTPELQARRAFLACGGDPSMTDNPLSALFASGRLDMIDADWQVLNRDAAAARHEAGRLLSLARNILFGRPGAKAAAMSQWIPGHPEGAPIDYETELRIMDRYEAADKALKASGRTSRSETVAVAVYGNWPEYHHPEYGVMPLDELQSHPLRRKHEALLQGLDALVMEFGLYAGRRAA